MTGSPRILITGFGPFPGAAENPTEALVRALAKEPLEAFGASALKALVLKTEYRRSWEALRRCRSSFAPDVVVHFGLNGAAEAIHIESGGRNAVDPAKLDAAGVAPSSPVLVRGGPATLVATLPVDAIVEVLQGAGFPVARSDDAGGYVCNATFYRSLLVAPKGICVGFVHVPPLRDDGLSAKRLADAAMLILRTAAGHWGSTGGGEPRARKHPGLAGQAAR